MPTFRSRSVPINITLYMSLSYGRILEAQYWILLFLLSDYSAPTPPWPLHNILVPKKGHSDARSSDFCKCMLLSNIFFIHLYFFILLIVTQNVLDHLAEQALIRLKLCVEYIVSILSTTKYSMLLLFTIIQFIS